jgi:hypothetical protein
MKNTMQGWVNSDPMLYSQFIEFLEFVDRLAWELIFGDDRRTRSDGKQDDGSPSPAEHRLRRLSEHALYSKTSKKVQVLLFLSWAKKAEVQLLPTHTAGIQLLIVPCVQLRCSICGNKASYHCEACSTSKKAVAVCSPVALSQEASAHTCFFEHRQP